MTNDCIICFEQVIKADEYITECGCKYTVHIKCIEQWNEKCVMCNKPTKIIPDPRELIIHRIYYYLLLSFIMGVICIILRYSNVIQVIIKACE